MGLIISNIKRIYGLLEKVRDNNKLFFAIIIILTLILLLDIRLVAKSRIPIKIHEVGYGDIVATVSAPGLVKATTAKLGVKSPGVVAWIGVDEGSKVEKGQLLLKLDGYENALKEYKRIKKLYKRGFVTLQQLENAKFSLDGMSIISPINGTASNVAVKEGETATPGYTLISVLSPAGMSIEIQIDQVDIGMVKKGYEVRVLSDAYPDEVFEGQLIYLNSEAEFKSLGTTASGDEEDKIFRGKVTLLNETTKLYSGMTVDTEIVTQRLNNVLYVPRESVISENEKNYVYIIRYGRAHKREIKISLKDAFNVGVESGLEEGDIVAASNLIKLKDKARIKIERK